MSLGDRISIILWGNKALEAELDSAKLWLAVNQGEAKRFQAKSERLEALNAELVALVNDLYQFRKRDYPNDITFDERVAKTRGES